MTNNLDANLYAFNQNALQKTNASFVRFSNWDYTHAGVNPTNNQNSIFTDNAQATPQGQEISTQPADEYAADDGKISFADKLKNFGKGLISPITSMFSSPKNFLIGAATIVGIGALTVATGGAITPLLVAGGVAIGGIQFAKGAIGAATAKTDAEAEQAWQNMGTGTVTVAGSVAGAKGALKAAGYETEGLNALSATAKCFKVAPKSVATSAETILSGEGLANLKGIFKSTKAEGEKTAQELYDEGAPDEKVIEKAKAERESFKNEKALTDKNQNSPQKEIYEQVDKIDSNNPEYLEHNKARVERFENNLEDVKLLEKQIKYQQERLERTTAKNSKKAIRDQIKVLESKLEKAKANTSETSTQNPVEVPTQKTVGKTSPETTKATSSTKTAKGESSAKTTKAPVQESPTETVLTNREAKLYESLKKMDPVELDDWITNNEAVQSEALMKKANQLIEGKLNKPTGKTNTANQALNTDKTSIQDIIKDTSTDDEAFQLYLKNNRAKINNRFNRNNAA